MLEMHNWLQYLLWKELLKLRYCICVCFQVCRLQ